MDAQHLRAALEDVRPTDHLAATIAHWNETPTKKGGFSLSACSYGIALGINHRIRWILWGTGYATDPIPAIVFGIASLLEIIPAAIRLEVNAMKDLQRYVEHGGIGQYAMENGGRTKTGKELGCYPAIGQLVSGHRAGRWYLRPHADIRKASWSTPAIDTARGKAKLAALQHKADFAPTVETYRKPIIVREHIGVFT